MGHPRLRFSSPPEGNIRRSKGMDDYIQYISYMLSFFLICSIFPSMDEAVLASPSSDPKWGIFVVVDSVYGPVFHPDEKLPEVSGETIFLEVFDRFGRVIYEEQFESPEVGDKESIRWSGMDNSGTPVVQGIYFFRITGKHRLRAFPINSSGDLLFSDVTSTHLPSNPTEAGDVEFGDVDNDGDPDIVYGINATVHLAQPRILINYMGGRYKDETELRLPELSTATNDVDLADVDGDGDLDIYLANTGIPLKDNRDLLLINDGKGYFQDESQMRLPPGMYATQNAEFADIDGDGDLDLALAILGGWPSWFELRLFLNDGNGFFVDETKERIPPSLDYTIFNLTFEDVDQDKDKDLIISSLGQMVITDEYGIPLDTLSGQNALLINDGAGYFSDQTEERMPPYDVDITTRIKAKDVDGDGNVDLFVVNVGLFWEEAANKLYLNRGEGFFAQDIQKRLPREEFLWNNDAELADFDDDGDVDIFLVNVLPGEEAEDNLLINEGGIFSDQSWRLPEVVDFSVSCAGGDMDGDHDLDLVIANSSGIAGIGAQDRLYENRLHKKGVKTHLMNSHPVVQNYPNPFNLSTGIVFFLPEDHTPLSPATIKIYNVTGKLVRTLICSSPGRGENRIFWDGKDYRQKPVSSGVYFYRLEAGALSFCGRMTLIK